MQLRTQTAILDDCFETVWAIAASDFCDEFIIGLTQQPLRARRYQYVTSRANPYQHMVLLCDRLTQSEAKELESGLQKRIWAATEGRESLGKYHKGKMVVRGSAGGVANHGLRSYSIYMSWLEKYGDKSEWAQPCC
jgi:hypothetical protein